MRRDFDSGRWRLIAECIAQARTAAQEAMMGERNSNGWWEGSLSSSALATATAVMALHLADAARHATLVKNGLRWLAETQCVDGGWGDTPQSMPNLSTTLLCRAAILMVTGEPNARCEEWVAAKAGGTAPAQLARVLEARYGKDRTFAVPILMACALSGALGPAPQCWRLVPQLPFELASLPRQWFAALRLPVVSYALPALIAIGQVRFHHVRGNPVAAPLRRMVRTRTLRLLREIQPRSGGFLEAVPLTAFVTMAMAGMNRQLHPVVSAAVAFLTASARLDGSWPIDTNLATWVTTLSINALSDDGGAAMAAGHERGRRTRIITLTEPNHGHGAVLEWLLHQQYKEVHSYTVSPPGGWAWTDLPGGVPDADDTSGALLALHQLSGLEHHGAALAGVRWLLQVQNRDGGIPTFCRGWGTLPFDRSTPEITAHALAALHAWRTLPEPRMIRARQRMLGFLRASQQSNGSWLPLWFGNERTPDESNPVYGTATVLRHLTAFEEAASLRSPAAQFLAKAQRPDGAWDGGTGHGPPSVEETALALAALAAEALRTESSRLDACLQRGAEALLELTSGGTAAPAAPIGLYFARLWYSEKLYPLIFQIKAWRALQDYLHGNGPVQTRRGEAAPEP